MVQTIAIENFWKDKENVSIVDVRTPAEFAKGHIPNAINLPLFSNEERVVVGTTYKQINPEAALLEGLDLVGPKMKHLVQQALKLGNGKKIVVHCWRGGKRSGSVGWLFDFAGLPVNTLEGGYKAYRHSIKNRLETWKVKGVILGGPTGCGKTDILKALEKMGEQVIDLEGLCNHKGSAFGSLGESPQPSIEQFENDLYEKIRHFSPDRRVWLENEGRKIGKIYLADSIWAWLNQSPLIHIDLPFEWRTDYLVKTYGQYSTDSLKAAFEHIRKRLGGQNLQTALQALDHGDLATATSIALQYYDKSYGFQLLQKKQELLHRLQFQTNVPATTAQQLIEYCDANDL